MGVNILNNTGKQNPDNNLDGGINLLDNSLKKKFDIPKEINKKIKFLNNFNSKIFGENKEEIDKAIKEIKKLQNKLGKGFDDDLIIEYINKHLSKIDQAFKTKIKALLNGIENSSSSATEPKQKPKTSNSGPKNTQDNLDAPMGSSSSVNPPSTPSSTPQIQSSSPNESVGNINVKDLELIEAYVKFKGMDKIKKQSILMYIKGIEDGIKKYPYLKEHKIIKNNIENILLILLDKKDYNSNLLDSYNKEKEKIVNKSKKAKESLPIVGLDEAFIGNFETIISIDPYITEIDDKIEKNLYNKKGKVKSAKELKDIGLNISLDLISSDNFKDGELSRFFDRLDDKSVKKLQSYYKINDLDKLKKQFITDINNKLSGGFKKEFNNIQKILETNDLQINLFGKNIIFKTLQDRNFALTSTLYFIEGFSKDPDGKLAFLSYFGGKAIDLGLFLSSTGISLIGDIGKLISGALLLFMIGYHTQRKLNQLFKENKEQEKYNKDSKKYLDSDEAPEEIKRRAKIIKLLEKRLKIESKNNLQYSNIYDNTIEELKEFERTQLNIKSNKVFYTKLFKTIYKYDGGMGITHKIMKGLAVPGTAGIVEELRGAPNLRGRPVKGFLSPIKYVLNKFSLSNINGNKKGTAIELGEFEGTFEEQLIKLANKSEKIAQIDSINKIFENVNISFKNELVDYIMKEVEKDLKTHDSIDISEDLKTKIEDIKNVLLEVEKLVKNKNLKIHENYIINTELKELVENVDDLDNFKKDIDNLKEKLINLEKLEIIKNNINSGNLRDLLNEEPINNQDFETMSKDELEKWNKALEQIEKLQEEIFEDNIYKEQIKEAVKKFLRNIGSADKYIEAMIKEVEVINGLKEINYDFLEPAQNDELNSKQAEKVEEILKSESSSGDDTEIKEIKKIMDNKKVIDEIKDKIEDYPDEMQTKIKNRIVKDLVAGDLEKLNNFLNKYNEIEKLISNDDYIDEETKNEFKDKLEEEGRELNINKLKDIETALNKKVELYKKKLEISKKIDSLNDNAIKEFFREKLDLVEKITDIYFEDKLNDYIEEVKKIKNPNNHKKIKDPNKKIEAIKIGLEEAKKAFYEDNGIELTEETQGNEQNRGNGENSQPRDTQQQENPSQESQERTQSSEGGEVREHSEMTLEEFNKFIDEIELLKSLYPEEFENIEIEELMFEDNPKEFVRSETGIQFNNLLENRGVQTLVKRTLGLDSIKELFENNSRVIKEEFLRGARKSEFERFKDFLKKGLKEGRI